MSAIPEGLTCVACHRPLYPTLARRTDDGWRHKSSRCPRVGCVMEGCDRKHQARGYCELHYKRIVLGRKPRTEIHIEDVEWMAETGECLTGAASRLGVQPTTLERFLYRAGRADLYRVLKGREVAVA